MDLTSLSAADIARMIRKREASASEVVNAHYARFAQQRTEKVHPLTKGFQRKQGNEPISAGELAGLLAGLDELRSAMWGWMQSYDGIICPVNARPAVPHGTTIEPEVFGVNSYVYPYNLSGWPAVSVRGGTSLEGLPIGVQGGARPWRQDVALALAAVFERELGGYRPPPL